MSFIIKALHLFISGRLFLALSLSTAAWYLLLFTYFKMDFRDIADLVPTRLYFGVIILNRLCALFTDLFRKRKAAFLNLGILIFLSGCLVNYAYRFEGTLSLGEGEAASGFEKTEKGPLARYKDIFVKITGIEGDIVGQTEKASVKMQAGRVENVYSLRKGEEQTLDKFWALQVEEVSLAPEIVITMMNGETFFSSFIKMRLFPKGKQDYLHVEKLPYRFYLSLSDDAEKPLRLKVLRGKLHLVMKDIALGEKIEFEGVTLSVPKIRGWAEISLRYYPGNQLLYAGMAVACLAALLIMAFPSRQQR